MSLTVENIRSAAQLQTIVEAGNEHFANLQQGSGQEATAQQVVAWVAEHFSADAIAVACSMADAVLPAVVAEQIPNVDVLFLDTGYHFPETYETRNEVARLLPIRVVDVLPKQSVAEQDAEFGAELFSRDPNLCCARRKVEPLGNELKNYELWFTGVRRDEAPTRTNTPLLTWDEKNHLIKVNPLAAWSFDDLVNYAILYQVSVNPLLNQGYPSIGCAPCTKPVAPGEDPRSGRWAGVGKTECGLHE